MVLILSDSDVARSCTAGRAIAVIRKAIHAHGEGRLAAPPRAHSELAASSRITFTAGALESIVHGVRIYDNTDSAEQLVAVWDAATGRLSALVLGAELGRRRTGAIGAVAIDTLARADAATLGVVGTGHQAWAQVWATTAIRTWSRIHIFGRNAYVRERFAARCREQLLVDAIPVETPEAAVRGMDAVIVATNSSIPVFETSWLEPGSHVTTLGPKTISAHEVPLDLLDRVEVVVTDSLVQVHGHREPYALSTRRMVELGAIMTGAVPGRTRQDQITLFCSVGLSGTEVVLAADLSGLPTGPTPAMTAALPVVPRAAIEAGGQDQDERVSVAVAGLGTLRPTLQLDGGDGTDKQYTADRLLAGVLTGPAAATESENGAQDQGERPGEPQPDEQDAGEPATDEQDAVEPATDEQDAVEPATDEQDAVEPATDERDGVGEAPAEPPPVAAPDSTDPRDDDALSADDDRGATAVDSGAASIDETAEVEADTVGGAPEADSADTDTDDTDTDDTGATDAAHTGDAIATEQVSGLTGEAGEDEVALASSDDGGNGGGEPSLDGATPPVDTGAATGEQAVADAPASDSGDVVAVGAETDDGSSGGVQRAPSRVPKPRGKV